jgi:flagellar hook-basal body complex protein FliE
MIPNIADALAAYKNGGGMASGASATEGPSGDNSFSTMLGGFINDGVKTLETGEKAAIDGASGKGSLVNVVTALNNAELLLTEVTTIRDKVISAYQDITRTSI